MELYFKKDYMLRQTDYRPTDTLSSNAILDVLQDVSGAHADLYHFDFKTFMDKGIVWMIVQSRIEMYEDIPLYATIGAYTWPRPKNKIDFMRDYKIEYNGKIVGRAVSRWVLVDAVKRRVIIPRDIDYTDELHYEDGIIELTRLHDFDIIGLEPTVFYPTYMDLDHNGHVNNTKYALYVENVLKLKTMKSFEIEFQHESKIGEKIEIYVKKEDNNYLAKGLVEGVPCFLAKIEGE